MQITTIGLDIAKSVFQVHGVDVAGAVVIRKRVTRSKVVGTLANCRHAWSGSKRVRRRIIAPATFNSCPWAKNVCVKNLRGRQYAVQHRELMPLINYARHKALLYKPL